MGMEVPKKDFTYCSWNKVLKTKSPQVWGKSFRKMM